MLLRTSALLLIVLVSSGSEGWAQLDLPRNTVPRVKPSKGLELPALPEKKSLLEEAFGQPSDAQGATPAGEPGAERPEAKLDLPLPDRGRDAALDPSFMDKEGAQSESELVFEKLIQSAPRAAQVPRLFGQLVALGEPALELARSQLLLDRPKRVEWAGKLLLRAGSASERAYVRDFLRGPVPVASATQLLRELVDLDPLLADPGYLMALLEHPQPGMRQAAAELAGQRVDHTWLPLLVATNSSKSSGLRLSGIELAAQLDSPAAERLLLASLGDRHAAIGLLAAQTLAALAADGISEALREVVFQRRAWDRAAGYGLVALVQREMNLGSSLLTEADVPWLLEGLGSRLELVAGAAAAALAGIGFRSSTALDSEWLQQRVPDCLIRLCTGYTFHTDLIALQKIGLPRLGLISGESFGSNGNLWQDWWADHGSSFRPRRSALTPLANEELNLCVSLSRGRGAALESFALVGPGSAAPRTAEQQPVFYLSRAEALQLMALLQEQGLFGAARLPGLHGAGGRGLISVRVGIRAGEKLFEAAPEDCPSWLQRVIEQLFQLREGLRWQSWFDPLQYASSFAFYEAEGAWWERVSEKEGQHRLKAMMLGVLAGQAPEQRAKGIQELSSHVEQHELLRPADFVPLMGLLRSERDYGTRFSESASSPARQLVALALRAAQQPSGALEANLAEELFEFVLGKFGAEAKLDLERILGAAGGDLLWRAAQASDPLRRALSARPLGQWIQAQGTQTELQLPSSLALMAELLMASEPVVACAALESVGAHRLQVCKPHALRRARASAENPARVRAAALRALGSLGGAGVHEVCVLALGEEDEDLVLAAVEALAQGADERNLALLVSLYTRGTASGFFEAARLGLERLGSLAHPELLALVVTAEPGLRRQTALLLAEGGVPQAASELLMILTLDPSDQRVAEELAILSATDMRSRSDPVAAWWGWWDGVVHDDSEAWFLAAMAREGFELPGSLQQQGEQTSVGLEDLLGWARVKEPILRERLRRELCRLSGRSIEPIPSQPAALEAWQHGVRRLSEQGG